MTAILPRADVASKKYIKKKQVWDYLPELEKKGNFNNFFVSSALFNKDEKGEGNISVEDRINGTEFGDIISHLVNTVMAFGNVAAIR